MNATQTTTNVFDDVPIADDTEPSDPQDIDHDARQSTRIAPPDRDTESLPRPLVECGCGECPDYVDPLADADDVPDDADDDGVFADVVDRRTLAADVCDDPRPVTVERGGDIWKAYKTAEHANEAYTSVLDRVEGQYGKVLGAERDIFRAFEDVTAILFSFRVSPTVDADDLGSYTDNGGGSEETVVDYDASPQDHTHSDKCSDDGRVWLSPLSLDARLRDGWASVRRSIRHRFDRFDDWAYAWIVATTDSAATPHRHVLVLVDDPDDDVSDLDVDPVVGRFVDATPGVSADDHPVHDDESDAAIIDHDPILVKDMEDETVFTILDHGDDDEEFRFNTAMLTYIMVQRTAWTLADVLGDGTAEDVALEGAAIEWASPYDWIGASRNIDLQNGDYGE